jgi:hypothetical protein
MKKKVMFMLASTWPSFRHNGILQFANRKLCHKNVSSICWRQGEFSWQLIMAGRKIMADLHVSNSSENKMLLYDIQLDLIRTYTLIHHSIHQTFTVSTCLLEVL